MKLEAKREHLLKPLQSVIGAVERRQTLPILTNVLVTVTDQAVTLTATDLEVELSARADLPAETPGVITLPARRLHDILRALPEDATVTLTVDGDKATVRCGRSRFTLATLPAGDFPTLENLPLEGEIRLPQADRTHPFCDGPAGCALLPQRPAAGGRFRGSPAGCYRRPPLGIPGIAD